jgi:hypothetical protein
VDTAYAKCGPCNEWAELILSRLQDEISGGIADTIVQLIRRSASGEIDPDLAP